MSPENVEIIRRGIEAWNQRDRSAFLASFRSDAELDWSRSRGPLKGVYRGPREIESFWKEFFSTFEEIRLEAHGITQQGSEVVVPNTAFLRGRDGIEVIARSTFVYTIEDGQTARLRMFQEQAGALETIRRSEEPVSRENVAIARRAMEAFNAGDLEAATAEMVDEIEWRPVGAMTHGEVIVGIDAVQRFWREWTETFDDFRLIIEDVFEAPAGAIAVTRATGRGATSGLELTGGSFFQVFEIRDGRVRGLRMFRSREEALAAARLSE